MVEVAPRLARSLREMGVALWEHELKPLLW